MKINRKIIMPSILVLLASIITIALAYFGAEVIMNNVTPSEVTTGKVNVTVSDNIVNVSALEPIYDEYSNEQAYKKDFTITDNTDSLNACTKIYLSITNIDEPLKSNHFKYKIVSSDGKESTGNFSNAVEGERLLILESGFLETGQSKDLSLYLWLSYSETDNQIEMLGKTFSAKVLVEGIDTKNRYECKDYTLSEVILEDNDVYADNVNSKYVQNTPEGINFSAISSNTNGKGLYRTSDLTKTEDIDGDGTGEEVLYFRGAVENNYIIFGEYNTNKTRYYNSLTYIDYETKEACTNANTSGTCSEYIYHESGDKMCWRIVRTNEDGSIKLRYSGVADDNGICPKTGSDVRIGMSAFNASYDDNAYVGYMYGDFEANSVSYEEAHENVKNSLVKTVVDNWYRDNIASNSYHSFVANSLYCNDRSVVSPSDMPSMSSINSVINNSGTGFGKGSANTTFYRAINSFFSSTSSDVNNYYIGNDKHDPTFKCINNNDKFTLSIENGGTDGYGNNDLAYPVGLLTIDEMVYAGGNIYKEDGSSTNSSFYLKNARVYWSLTPGFHNGSGSYILVNGGSGHLHYSISSNSILAVIPAISIKSSSVVSKGTGTYDNPYIIKVD